MNLLGVLTLSLLGACNAHMGVSNPVSMDAAVGDAYRYPNAGVCHGKKSGGTALSGETSMKLSSGAAHNGGPCAVFHCPTLPAAAPTCVRNVVVTPAGCTKVIDTDQCTIKGSMDTFTASESSGFYMWYWTPKSSGQCEIYMNCWEAGGDGTTTTATNPPTNALPAGGTLSKIRCGTSWGDANTKCGTECLQDSACPMGELCYADLADCPGAAATPVVAATTPAPVDQASGCVSISSFVQDEFCQKMGCTEKLAEYCGYGGSSKASTALTAYCVLHVVQTQELFQDIAFRYDIADVEDLKAINTGLSDPLAPGTVLEIPGDCELAREEAGEAADDAGASISMAKPQVLIAAVALIAVVALA